MTTANTFWAWWVVAWVLGTFAVAETTMILLAHYCGERHITEWTLSDAIRRWSAWLAPVTIGVMAMLAWHWFAQGNLP